jgi:hypothetical protein
MSNSLARVAHSGSGLYQSTAADLMSGELEGLAWNTRRGGLTLMPSARATKVGSARMCRGSFISRPVDTENAFLELLPSWNLSLNDSTQGYRVQIRVGDREGKWSPWLYFGSGGTATGKSASPRTSVAKWGDVKVDYLMLKRAAVHFQFRVDLEGDQESLADPAERPVLRRLFAAYAGEVAAENASGIGQAAREKSPRRRVDLKVPYRSQTDVPVKKLRSVICCPTCIAMALEWHGVDKPTLDVCAEAYDPEHKIYGMWPRAAQTAANNGMIACVQRFGTHTEVREALEAGTPLVASIRVRSGELSGAKYRKSKGHLILIRGFTAAGNYIVNDPYSPGPRGKEIEYAAADLDKVWLDKGGVAIVMRKPDN